MDLCHVILSEIVCSRSKMHASSRRSLICSFILALAYMCKGLRGGINQGFRLEGGYRILWTYAPLHRYVPHSFTLFAQRNGSCWGIKIRCRTNISLETFFAFALFAASTTTDLWPANEFFFSKQKWKISFWQKMRLSTLRFGCKESFLVCQNNTSCY